MPFGSITDIVGVPVAKQQEEMRRQNESGSGEPHVGFQQVQVSVSAGESEATLRLLSRNEFILRQGPGSLSNAHCLWTLVKFVKSLHLPLPHL